MRNLTVTIEAWPIKGRFAISRGAKTEAEVIVVTLEDGPHRGRGECVPYGRYGETLESVAAQIDSIADEFQEKPSREKLMRLLPAGAARNALDCALWDLEAKWADMPVWQLAGLPKPEPLTTAFTLSLDTPKAMHEAAKNAASRPLLKIKLGGEGDLERLAAVREGAPGSGLIVDANEGWAPDNLERLLSEIAPYRVALIEQPLPAGDDACLASVKSPIPLCADESCHTSADLVRLASLYDAVNIKLDKTGGFTEALHTIEKARGLGMEIMIGCMVGTSLAMAPAALLAAGAAFVDLDGPLLLAEDREPGLRYEGSVLFPPEPALWG